MEDKPKYEINNRIHTFEVRDLRHKEKFVLDDAFLNGYGRIVGAPGIAVYVTLCRHVDKNQKCFPSQAVIGEKTGLIRQTVNIWIQVLAYLRIIQIQRVGNKCNNRYLLLDKKYWRTDWQIMAEELSAKTVDKYVNKSRSDVVSADIRCRRTRHQVSSVLTSIVRSSQSKDAQRKDETQKLLSLREELSTQGSIFVPGIGHIPNNKYD